MLIFFCLITKSFIQNIFNLLLNVLEVKRSRVKYSLLVFFFFFLFFVALLCGKQEIFAFSFYLQGILLVTNGTFNTIKFT